MPWSCCGKTLLDSDLQCAGCGGGKRAWTTRLAQTRLFQVGGSSWIEIELVDPAGKPIPHEPYLVVTSKGKEIRGTLDELGFARVKKPGKKPCTVSFPEIDQRSGKYAFGFTPVPRKPKKELHWLELELQDDHDPPRPVAKEPYEVILPDGSTREGELDDKGRARLEELPPGECEVRFPKRDVRDSVCTLAFTPAPRHIAQELGWIEIELRDEQDPPQPLAGEPYVVICSDGSKHEGELDDQGQARLEEIPLGECQVWFPKRDVQEGVYGFERPASTKLIPGPPRGWIEVELLDDRDPPKPVAEEPYRITDPEGAVFEGKTDAKGRVRVEDLACGPCLVEFPQRDARDGGQGFSLPAALASKRDDAPERNDWLEIELVEGTDPPKPLAGEPYRVELPDGSSVEGKLDKRGRARLSELPAGTCQVFFPQRDASEQIQTA